MRTHRRHPHRRRPRPTARARGIPRGRTLHLIDIENLAGARRELDDILAAGEAYKRTITLRPGDHTVVGCDRTLLLAAEKAFPGARIVPGRGPDGADRALLGYEDVDDIARRYDRVVIGSGDHAFCGLVARLRDRGVAVCVVCRREALSADLRRAAALVIDLRLAA
jgi:hypothetical protein